jgi:phosphatidylethanolamine/phosphatidyl-N-methylethanolamine N-methyltransferase
MEIKDIKAAYRRYAPVYDLVFGPIFSPGRRQIINSLDCRPGDRILEVGLGTGLSLPLYPKNVRVTGIDVSAEMLKKASRRVKQAGLSQVDAVLEMNAEETNFADGTFDKVVAMYVVSVVPDPVRMVQEMSRVCKAEGDIFIVNHFCSRNAVVGAVEKKLEPLSALAGFRPNIELDDFLRNTQLEVMEMCSANMFGYWKVLRCRNDGKWRTDKSLQETGQGVTLGHS